MGMRALLVRPPFFSSLDFGGSSEGLSGREIELGLLYLASYLESHGIAVSFLDMSLYKDAEKRLIDILKNNFYMIGITAYSSFIKKANEVAGIIKKYSASKVVIGGHHASALPIQTLDEFSNFDYLVYGEGEETLYELLTRSDISNIRGVVYKDNGKIKQNAQRERLKNLDCLPFPARHLLEIDKYVPVPGNYKTLPSTGILSSRGCFYKCTFCSRCASRLEDKVEFRSVENIIAEIEECISKYNISDFRFYDDTFPMPRRRLVQFCEECIKKDLRITWNCYARVDMVDMEMLKFMKRAGCYHIKYGVEFGTQKWLDETKKHTTLRQAEETIRNTKKAGIAAKASFMIGMPGETEEEIKQTISFAKKYVPLIQISIFLSFCRVRNCIIRKILCLLPLTRIF